MLDVRQVEGVLVDLLVTGAAEHLLHLGSVFRLHSTVLEDQQGHPPHITHHTTLECFTGPFFLKKNKVSQADC